MKKQTMYQRILTYENLFICGGGGGGGGGTKYYTENF